MHAYTHVPYLIKSYNFLDMQDFFLTVTLAVFWLSGSAAWANGLNGLKGTLHSISDSSQCKSICKVVKIGSFSELNISVVSYTVIIFYNAAKQTVFSVYCACEVHGSSRMGSSELLLPQTAPNLS